MPSFISIEKLQEDCGYSDEDGDISSLIEYKNALEDIAASIPLGDIQALVDYSWSGEERDYELQDEHDQQNHIFLTLQRLKDYLESNL